MNRVHQPLKRLGATLAALALLALAPSLALAQPQPDAPEPDEPAVTEPAPDTPQPDSPKEGDDGDSEDAQTGPRKVEPVKTEPAKTDPVKTEPVKTEVEPKRKEQARPMVERPTNRPNVVTVYKDQKGFKLLVDGKDFMIYGMNWTYIPIGENYAYSLWTKSDAFIMEALDYEMTLLKKMGINAIRQYDDIPPKWVTYIYEKYGIYTMVNNTVGRYGALIDGSFVYPTNYQDARTREALKEQVLASINKYKDVPGVLFYLLGNENNYGLVWSSFEIENLPGDDDDRYRAKAEYLYSLFGEIADEIKKVDTTHPIAIANGDLQFIDLIATYCKNVDIMGSNVYRGVRSGDLYQRTLDELGKPFVYTEFGADAYNAKEKREDGLNQAWYLRGQWEEIYEQSYGQGKAANSLGGFIFQWSDGWWKYGQSINLETQDTTASWVTGAYPHDFVEGQNNMNEEWFGICAKGPRDKRGFFPLYCRHAYYLLKDAFKLDPYAPTTTPSVIKAHFAQLDPADYGSRYAAEQADLRLGLLEGLRLSQLRLELSTFTTSNSDAAGEGRQRLSVQTMESVYFGFEAKPADNVKAEVVFNVVGSVPTNRIDEFFYEAREVTALVGEDGQEVQLSNRDAIALYQASFEWKEKVFDLEGFHRVGHYHWGYEGDFFGLYPEANYQHIVDLFAAPAPSGVLFTGKEFLEGLKVAAGPQLWWGANPSVVAKYYRQSGAWEYSLMHQEDIANPGGQLTSSVIVAGPPQRKSTLYMAYTLGKFKLELGGAMAGTERLGEKYVATEPGEGGEPTYLDSGQLVYEDEINLEDTLGGKLRLSYEGGMLKWYGQGGYQGLVSNVGVDQRQTFGGWFLKSTGIGNHYHFLSGAAVQVGDVMIGPNVLYQKPLVGPTTPIDGRFSDTTNTYYQSVFLRNVLTDPFAVRQNREMLAAELMLSFDPTPGTWLFQWDNPDKEDAFFAGSLNLIYKRQPTAMDSGLFISADNELLPFGESTPAQDVWDLNARLMFRFNPDLRLHNHLYVGQSEPNNGSTRRINRFGGSAKLMWNTMVWDNYVKVNDWGPFDFHRDFNLTFPLQLFTDLSYGLTPMAIGQVSSRFGVQVKLRYLDEFSPPNVALPGPNASFSELGHEYEVGTYIRISL